jgi:predicted CXXCH cytochrome family protein
LSALCFALLAGQTPARADIRDTKHNLTGRAAGGAQGADSAAMRRAEREVCVFCHTPSLDEAGANRDRVVTPQWQRSVEATFAFELWDDIGRADTGTGGAIGSVSMACLSCHDDVQAFGVAPGTGSDHPFGVPYRGIDRGGEKASDYRKRLLIAQEAPVQVGLNIRDEEEFRPARTGTINRRQIWWTSVTDTGQRTKNDLPLYPRRIAEGAGNYAVVPFIECTSCHDPHSTREVFLRTSNEGSRLCLTCHVK